MSDPSNCGACGYACEPGAICNLGYCECPAGTHDCSGACVDTGSDNANCGSCGNACTPPDACSGGSCVPTCSSSGGTCTDSSQCCAGLDCIGGTCDTCSGMYPKYCPQFGGMCTQPTEACSTIKQCPDGMYYICDSDALSVDCNSNRCVCPTAYPVYCPPTMGHDGTCWGAGGDCSTLKDCGGTLIGCFPGTHVDCSMPTTCYCNAGLHYCAGVSLGCIDLSSDTSNCGSCGYVCPGGDSCVGGFCQAATPTCPTGETYCSGYGCVDLNSNWANCGYCGNSCHTDPVCDPGFGCISCYYDCESGSCHQVMCSG